MKTIMQAVATAIAVAFAAGAPAADAPGTENSACESDWAGGDFVQFTCPLPVHGTQKKWRFKAEFSGGHDDTSASMKLTIDGAPLDCETGSKTKLFGEDGDVSLECHFRVGGHAGPQPVLGVALLWSHAQYARTELVVE
jgi:hypothetical protein